MKLVKMKQIQMVDLRSQYDAIKEDINRGIQDVLDTATYVKGGKVKDFQQHLEEYLGVKHVIPVGNGTDAKQIKQSIPALAGTGRFWYTDPCMKNIRRSEAAPEWRNTYESCL